MRRGHTRRAMVALAGAWIGLSVAAGAAAQEPQPSPADTLRPDSLAAEPLIPPDPFISVSPDSAPGDTLPAPFLPGIDAPQESGFPWLVEFPGWHGLAIEHYNRVDGLTPSWGLALEPLDPLLRPELSARIAAATTHSRLYWSGSARQRLPLPGAIHVRLEHFHRSTTFDDWKVSIQENDIATFAFASDLLDWWREKGYALALEAETPDGRWGGTLIYLDATQRAQRDRSPFALFGANYRDNPPAVEGDLHSLSALVQVDTRDIQSPLLPSPGWWLRADAELAGGVLGGELDFRRGAIELERFSRFGQDVWWNTRAVWMGPLDGDTLPVQRHVMLGGPGSLRGFRGGSFVDSQGGQISSEVRLPLPVGRRIALLFLSWHWVGFADAGALGDYEEWHANVGTGISGVNLLSFIEIFVAQRITDLDEDGSGPRFVVRFRRDL
ncbi:MAG TPA: BamA/TamA family outer membrane protein [Gemmatimonadota bacterium]|nr:BamA/TamA family outer membrane protein [Gemmatimonadota bacterium]